MLLSLAIRDFVIVDQLELDFSAGFTVLSGETGAGKSILIDALSLVLGERADASVVRENCQRADICATFSIPDSLSTWLQEQGFDAEEDLLLLRRVVDNSGRTKAYINGASATLGQLREAGEFLVDIHGQHAHQSLLKNDAQRTLLEGHAGLIAQSHQLATAFRHWHHLNKQIQQLNSNAADLERVRERLQWQVEELQQLAPQAGEWEEVQNEHSRLAHAASLLEGAQTAVQVLSENDGALLDQLSAQMTRLQQLVQYDAALQPVLEALEPAQIQIQEAVSSLHHYLGRTELDPQRLQEVAARVETLHGAARKFRVTPEELPTLLATLSAELQQLQSASDMAELEAQAAQALAAYQKQAKTLSQQRAKAAKALSSAVTQAMQTLSMAGGKFEVALTPNSTQEPASHGLEQIEFLVAGHAGVAARPLNKVASGGELARISLALAVITSAATPVPTLIFDEVDSGIGGAVAEVVGKLLRQLGHSRQVLCVTHLPQVAAQGEHHLCVSKAVHANGQTLSQITVLERTTRIEEIARMLGGVEITDTTRKHARELLAKN